VFPKDPNINHMAKVRAAKPRACLVSQIHHKFYYAKRRFSITSKYRHIYGVLNVNEIKN
jgi:hypothetical protein